MSAGTRNQDAFSAIAAKILSGELVQGERLSEPKLAAELQLSRAPVREALRALERVGLVLSMPNRGAFVARATADQAAEAFAIRESLEPQGLRRALERPELVQVEWKQALDEMETAAEARDIVGMFTAHHRFHGVAYTASGARLLADVWERVHLVQRQYFQRHSMSLAQCREFVAEHRELAESALESDGDAVEAMVVSHLREGAKRLPFPFGAASRAERWPGDLRLAALADPINRRQP